MADIRCIDLFCGAGGLSAGLEESGIVVVAAIEKIEVFCKTFKYNFPDAVTITGDISDITPHDFSERTGINKGSVNLIAGGPPCKTFSTIGVPKIKSVLQADIKSDPRNYLYQQFFDYVEYYDPDIFLMENVPRMKSVYKGVLFNRITDFVVKLGYEPHSAILNSLNYGVPQSRKRLFLVGTKNGIRFQFPEPTHALQEHEQGTMTFNGLRNKNPRTVYDAIGDLPIISDGCRDDELPCSKNENLTEYQLLVRNKTGVVRNNICRVSNERAKRIFRYMEQGSRYMDLDSEIRKILPFREDIFHDRLKRLDMSKPSWTVLAHIGMDGYMYIHPTQNRTLSVREAARIQSFRDSFIITGNMREQYVQVGNAVPPLLAQAIGNCLRTSLG